MSHSSLKYDKPEWRQQKSMRTEEEITKSVHFKGLFLGCCSSFHHPENKHLLPADRKPGEEPESLVGKQVEYVTDNGVKRTGLVIYQVPAKPTVYYIKYDDDVHIHVYDLVKTT